MDVNNNNAYFIVWGLGGGYEYISRRLFITGNLIVKVLVVGFGVYRCVCV